MLEEPPKHRAAVRRTEPFELREIRIVHREYVIELIEVGTRHLSRAQVSDLVAVTPRDRNRASVGRLAHVKVGGSRGVDFEIELREFSRREGSHHPFRGRRTTDVSQTNNQEFHRPSWHLFPHVAVFPDRRETGDSAAARVNARTFRANCRR
jgi:hypothetical protein